MVQDSSKNGPVVFNLRSLNFWRVHALYEIGCKMLCIWAFKLLFCSQRLGGWSPAPAWTRVVLQYLLYDFDSLRKKKMIWLGQDFCPLVSFLSFFLPWICILDFFVPGTGNAEINDIIPSLHCLTKLWKIRKVEGITSKSLNSHKKHMPHLVLLIRNHQIL